MLATRIHYPPSHLDHFSDNRGYSSEHQRERLQHDIKTTSDTYQRRWDTHLNLKAGNFENFQWDCPRRSLSRKSNKLNSF
ncbi:hypothetical protein PR048_015670 [Dryococelus australis]|uniref:Uncharacterized protein n=1 Tax=Dryococelus australis TaxID=614101 RepID=A0ABQ9HHK3_9NEOP|nr:hypothetical protein PR048_015670 [Dryococelus australis]